jgi:hypothetical protein
MLYLFCAELVVPPTIRLVRNIGNFSTACAIID